MRMRPVERLLHAAAAGNALLASAARALVVALVGIMVASIVWQVVTRAVFNRSPPWTEEVALLAFGWIVLLMLALCTREHLHVRVDLLLTALPERASRWVERAIALLVAGIAAYLLWAGSSYLMEMRGATSQAVKYPSWLLYGALPVTAAMLFLFAAENALRGPPARGEHAE